MRPPWIGAVDSGIQPADQERRKRGDNLLTLGAPSEPGTYELRYVNGSET
ncbi:MAG: hypothetical protein MI824_13330 [Hyphomicrobiales bacterium]|nr:hypothetical protein [Hyphomicrobiales bacterium]